MKQIQLKDGTTFSRIGVGCMRISRMSVEDVEQLVSTALDHGITFFDHADIYGGGQSEVVFGEALKRHPQWKDQMFIQSKCAIHDGQFDFSKQHIYQSVDGILERLQVDHIDSLLLHRPDALFECDEVNEAFSELKRQGKVRHFGVSNMNGFQMDLLQDGLSVPLEFNQLQLSLAHTPVLDHWFNVNMAIDHAINRDGGILEYARKHDVVLQAWSPLQVGFFQGVFLNHPDYPELNAKLQEIADVYGVDLDTIAYAWILRLPLQMQVITGTTKPERLISAAKAMDITLTRTQWYDLYKSAGNQLP